MLPSHPETTELRSHGAGSEQTLVQPGTMRQTIRKMSNLSQMMHVETRSRREGASTARVGSGKVRPSREQRARREGGTGTQICSTDAAPLTNHAG
jgi:hypothetical protein